MAYTIKALHPDWHDYIERCAQLPPRSNTLRDHPPHIDPIPNTYDTIRRVVMDAHRWRSKSNYATIKTVTLGYIMSEDLIANTFPGRTRRSHDYRHLEGKRIRLADSDRVVVVHIDLKGLPLPLDPLIYAQLQST